MEEVFTHEARLLRRAFWLIKCRWFAVIGTAVTVTVAHFLFSVSLQILPLYVVIGFLALENVICFGLLNRARSNDADQSLTFLRRIVQVQISTDLVLLTALLHFSGGVENPFIVYFVFHIAIAGILSRPGLCYRQATLAVCLLVLMVVLEYQGILAHYPLEGFVTREVFQDPLYLMVSVGVLASTLYLVAYMTSDIAAQLYRQQEAYRQANIQLERKDRIKDEYVARVTHHVKGHLAAIQSCNDVVVLGLAGPLSDKQKQFIDKSAARTRSLVTFVKKLLRLTQMRLSDDHDSSQFSLTDTLSAAVAGAMSGAEEKGISLTSEVSLSRDTIYGEPFSIDEIVTTMLFNAIKFTPAGGTVTVRAKEEDGHIRVDIADTGIGIPEQELSRVFDEFYRASNASAMEKEGTGLGLAIARQVVERHGGRIWVESEEGKGSVFSVTFPLVIGDQ